MTCLCDDFSPCCCADRLGPLTWREALPGLLRLHPVLAAGPDALAALLGRTSDADRAYVAERHRSAIAYWPIRQIEHAVDHVIDRLGDEPTPEALLEELVAEFGDAPTTNRWREAAGTLAGTIHQRAWMDGELDDMTRRERMEWDEWVREIRFWPMPTPQPLAIAAE